MIKVLLFDFSRVLLRPLKKNYTGGLNAFHTLHKNEPSYLIEDYFILNTQLLEYLEKLKENYELYIFTTGSIQNEPQFRQTLDLVFKKIYTVGEIGIPKDNPQSYTFILNDINRSPKETFFVDDSIENVEAAKKVGIQAVQYLSNEKLFEDFRKLNIANF